MVFVFIPTMALSGFLLFQVQPMMARFILPWFGGSATTWTASMLFFQAALLVGYAYAHLFTRPLTLRGQVLLHCGLILLGLLSLPITPADAWKPDEVANPTLYIFLLLTVCVGMPYAILSATSPLLQNWLGIAGHRTPSQFFAVSNFGSFLGLLSYPFAVDPLLATTAQTRWWSVAFVAFGVLMAGCGLLVLAVRGRMAIAHPQAIPDRELPGMAITIKWGFFSALGSVLLLATTNSITSYVPVNPFLWVVPLSLYLLSFVIVFAGPGAYRPAFYVPAFLAMTIFALVFAIVYEDDYAAIRITAELAAFALGCMICHGELAHRQPPPRQLTFYYVIMAAGGVAGGLFVSLAAPVIFPDYWEFPLGLLTTGLVGVHVLGLRSGAPLLAPRRLVMPALLVVALGAAIYGIVEDATDVISQRRNFYGVLKVVEEGKGSRLDHRLSMYQAGENQGEQMLDAELRRLPACDFGADSGLGLALDYLAGRNGAAGRRIGVIGLGAGMLATYGKPSDSVRYYELNPAVTDMARSHFSYLKDSAARIDVAHGDGRLLLEREIAAGSRQYDLLHIDAFRGNAPPVHLMTKEAFDIYLRHLKSDGLLVVTSHSDYYSTSSLLRGLADKIGMRVEWFEAANFEDCGSKVGFAVFSRDPGFFAADKVRARISAWPDHGTGRILWTDQSSSLMSLMIWH
ncbi:MAG: hypothetical protein EPO23_11095 [Xanthobacteraceae bacterium]|nr:MAG: hypothetical protein EPO23_11095 [Xanthobacteraceae bacterium]